MIRRYTHILVTACLLAGAAARAQVPGIDQITTHPGNDTAPAVSPDGKWAAIVSDRSGNRDIWLARLPRGRYIQITRHPADDFDPAWAPDSRRIAFVSKRRDADGDIWMLSIDPESGLPDASSLRQITPHLGTDMQPVFAGGGARIVYTSRRDGGELNIWDQDLAGGEPRRITALGGRDPALSPSGAWLAFSSSRYHRQSDIMLISIDSSETETGYRAVPLTWGAAIDSDPVWSYAGSRIMFCRTGEDTDNDGRVTPADNRSLWIKVIGETRAIDPNRLVLGRDELQITADIADDFAPAVTPGDTVLFVSNRGGGIDIWSLPFTGLFPRREDAAAQYLLAQQFEPAAVSGPALEQLILGYRRVEDYFPQASEWCARSARQVSAILTTLGRIDAADRNLRRMIRLYGRDGSLAAAAELDLAALSRGSLDERISRCRDIVGKAGDDNLAAEAELLLGDLLLERGDIAEAAAAYSRAAQKGGEGSNMAARAGLKVGDLFAAQGQEATARESWLSVLRNYAAVPLWREQAGRRLLGQVSGGPAERIAGFQAIVDAMGDVPALAAEAHFATADILMQEREWSRALRELKRVEPSAPGLEWAAARSSILQAVTLSHLQEDLKAYILLEETAERYRFTDGGLYAAQANDTLFSLYLRSARDLAAHGDYALAGVRFQRASLLKPGNIEARRGLVEAAWRSGTLDNLIQRYELDLSGTPADKVLLYSLGLAYSYRGQNSPETLEHSNDLLLRSLEEDYRLIYPYRTLGYNYELLENLALRKEMETPGTLEKIGRVLIAPLRMVASILPGRDEEGETGYTEKAIDVLTTALELNDETRDREMETYLAQNLANNYFNLGEFGYRNAFRYYTYRLQLDTAFASLPEKATFYERAGRCGVTGENTEQAVVFLETASSVYRAMGRYGDARRTRRQTAFLYQISGDYEQAVMIYEDLAVKDEAAGRLEDAERGYRNIAFNYHLLGEADLTLAYALRAASILEAEGFSVEPVAGSKLRIEILGLSIPVWTMDELGGSSSEGFTRADDAALLYGLISRSYESMKQFAEAVTYEERRLDLFQRQEDRLAVRISLHRLGRLHFQWTRYADAWDFFERSRKQCRKSRDMRGLYANLLNQGSSAMAMLESTGADSLARASLRLISRELDRTYKEYTPSEEDRAALLASLGTLYTGIAANRTGADVSGPEQLAGAVQTFSLLASADSCFQAALAAGDRAVSRGEILKNAAEVSRLGGSLQEALLRAEKSLTALEAEERRDLIWRVTYLRAALTAGRNRGEGIAARDSVLQLYTRAMDQLEASPVRSDRSEEIRSDRSDRRTLYIDAALEMARRGKTTEALAAAERGRQKQAADMLMRRPPVLKRERHKILWSNLRFIKSRLWDLDNAVAAEEASGASLSALAALRREQRSLRQEYEDVVAGIRVDDPVLAWLSGIEPPDVRGAALSLKKGMGALVYAMNGDCTLIWTVDRDTTMMTVVDAGRDEMSAIIARLRDSEDESALRQLTDLLLEPVESRIDNYGTLLIVPDRELWDVPFAALGRDGFLLADRVDLVYAPALTLYPLARAQRKVGRQTALFAGAPSDEPLSAALGETAGTVIRLTSREAAAESAVRERMPDADIIHLERWSLLYENDPFNSAIVLYPDGHEDGYIRAFDLFDTELKAGLVILPSSQGRSHSGSLAFFYSLLYAGVPAVIERSGPADRDAEALWSRTFYSALKTMSAAGALAEAQAALRAAFPERQWARYQLIGFEGLDSEERIAFARENLVARVREGQAYEQQGEFRRALSMYDQAAGMAAILKDSVLVGRILDISLAGAVRGSLWTRAAAYQQRIQLRAQQSGNTEEMQTSLRNLIAFYRREGRLGDAAETQSRYNRLAEERGNPGEEAASSREMAMILMLDRKWAEAEIWAARACSLYTELGDTVELGRALLRKGRIHLEAEDAWQAREDLRTGISLLEGGGGDDLRFEIASGYQMLGLASEKMSRYDEAIAHQIRGRDLFMILDRPLQAAQGVQYLANVSWKKGDFRQAMIYQNEALAVFKENNNEKLLSMGYATQGLISMGLGETGRAREQLNHAYDLAESTGSREDQSAILKNLGILSLRESRLEEAEAYFSHAVAIDTAIDSRAGLAYGYRNLGILKARMNLPSQGIPLLRKSLSLSRELRDTRNIVQSCYGLGICLHDAGRYREAAAVLDSGLVYLGDYTMPDLEWRLLWRKAKTSRELSAVTDAIRDYQRAAGVVETMRQSLSAEAFKQGFLEDKADLYADVISYFLALGRPADALAFAERAKSRSFIDMLAVRSAAAGGSAGAGMAITSALRDSIDDYRYRLGSLESRPGARTPALTGEIARVREELGRLENRYTEEVTAFQAQHPESADLIMVEPITVAAIEAQLSDSTALIEYFVHGDQIVIWVVKLGGVYAEQVTVTGASLDETVRGFRNMIISFLSADMEAQRLYDLLIRPVEARLRGVRHLVIVPHAILHYCPFGALENSEGGVLLEQYSLSLAPSSTVFGYCRSRAASRPRPDNPRILAVSNPALGPELDLPFAAREVSTLQRTYPQVTVLAGAGATEQAVTARLPDFDIVHFACHAEFNPEAPLFSALLLAPAGGNNGRLEAHELFGLDLNCSLVTLSACESGLGRIAGGDDIVGLTRGFIYAGAPALVTSLWKVDDLATAVLIKRFYRHLQQGMRTADALRLAQLWVREQVNPQPSAWAAFGVTGEFE
ncbi:CHAT domain-containing protein [bacterium]|nr:CHAT domain-containing protein [bacterium]